MPGDASVSKLTSADDELAAVGEVRDGEQRVAFVECDHLTCLGTGAEQRR
jgi:hypothetical protein